MGLLVRVALAVAANAVALLLAAILLDGVDIDAGSFVATVAVFSTASLLVRPLSRVVGRLQPRYGAS